MNGARTLVCENPPPTRVIVHARPSAMASPGIAAEAATDRSSGVPCTTVLPSNMASCPTASIVIPAVGATLPTVTVTVAGAVVVPFSSFALKVTTYVPPSSGRSVNLAPAASVPVGNATPFFVTFQSYCCGDTAAKPGFVTFPSRTRVSVSLIVTGEESGWNVPLTVRPIAAVGVAGLTVTRKVFSAVWPSLSVTVTSTL